MAALIMLGMPCAASPQTAQPAPALTIDNDDDDDTEDAEASERAIALLDSAPSHRIAYELLGGAAPEQALLFAGFDIWRHGFSAYGGIQWTPDRFKTSGMFVRMTASETVAKFNDSNGQFTTQIARGALLSGLRVQRDRVELQIYAGPDSEIDVVRPDNLYAKKRGLRFGLRAGLDAWWQPTALTMLTTSLSGSTIGPSYTARLAAGIRLLDRFWLGPEIAASGDQFSDQVRFGAHLTGLKIRETEWSLGTGYVRDSTNRDGFYGRIGIFTRQ